jgi:hypothetical protein
MMTLASWRAASLALAAAMAASSSSAAADTIYQCGFRDGAPVYTINTKPHGAKCRAINAPSESSRRKVPVGAKCRTMRFRETVFYRCEKDGVTWVYNRPVNGPSAKVEPVGSIDGAGGPESVSQSIGRTSRAGLDETLTRIVRQASRDAGIPEALLKAVIEVESGFRPDVVSPAGAQGLMQLMPITADSLDVEDPFEPEQNVKAGARLLRQLSDRFNGDLERTIAAYYAGASAVKRAGGPPDDATVTYVRKVISHYGKYSAPARNPSEVGADFP